MKYLIVAAALFASACGGDSPTGPSGGGSSTTLFYAVTGTVTSQTGSALAGATVRVIDGPNAGLAAPTDAAGRYTLPGLSFAGFNIQAIAAGHLPLTKGVFLQQGQATKTENFTLLTDAPWRRAGRGNTVFDMPRYFSRVRIEGMYAGYSSNFIVHIGGRGVVNELLGRAWGPIRYDGVHLTNGGGIVELLHSAEVDWIFTEAR